MRLNPTLRPVITQRVKTRHKTWRRKKFEAPPPHQVVITIYQRTSDATSLCTTWGCHHWINPIRNSTVSAEHFGSAKIADPSRLVSRQSFYQNHEHDREMITYIVSI